MILARKLALLLTAGSIAPSLHAGAILQLYTERISSAAVGATMGPIGYYNPSDPTLVSNTQIVSPTWTQGGNDVHKVSNTATYQSDSSVNRSKVLNACAGGFCASDPSDEGLSVARASGHADAGNLRVGGYAYADNIGAAPGAIATSRSTVTTGFRITSGGSGLADGTVVDLNWLYHLEGTSQVAGRAYPNLTYANANVNSNAKIVSREYAGEGENILAGVTFGLDLSLSQLVPDAFDPSTGLVSGHQSWSAYSNTGFSQDAYQSYYDTFQGNGPFSRSVNVDSRTGMFGLDYVPFQVKVGEWLDLTLDLQLYSQSGGGASAFTPLVYGSSYNDYFNTLKSSFEVGGSAAGLGLQFEFDAPGAASTAEAPEPGTWFAGLGLALVLVGRAILPAAAFQAARATTRV